MRNFFVYVLIYWTLDLVPATDGVYGAKIGIFILGEAEIIVQFD